MHELNSLRDARDALDDQIQRIEWGLSPSPPPLGPQPTQTPSQIYPSSHLFTDKTTDPSSSSSHSSGVLNGNGAFRSAAETDTASRSSNDNTANGMHIGSSSSRASDSTGSSSSSSQSSVDFEEDAELAGYQEALDNLKQQRDAVSHVSAHDIVCLRS